MISYFDTSAIVPLLIDEPSSDRCARLWNEASRIVSVRLLYPEACAALGRAVRMHRITERQMSVATAELDELVLQIDHVELTGELAHAAGRLAQDHGLRGYDAVHLAAAVSVADDHAVIVTGDADLAAAATARRIATSLTFVPPG